MRELRVTATLRDGSASTSGACAPSDAPCSRGLRAAQLRVAPPEVHQRQALARPRELAYLTHVDGHRHEALGRHRPRQRPRRGGRALRAPRADEPAGRRGRGHRRRRLATAGPGDAAARASRRSGQVARASPTSARCLEREHGRARGPAAAPAARSSRPPAGAGVVEYRTAPRHGWYRPRSQRRPALGGQRPPAPAPAPRRALLGSARCSQPTRLVPCAETSSSSTTSTLPPTKRRSRTQPCSTCARSAARRALAGQPGGLRSRGP